MAEPVSIDALLTVNWQPKLGELGAVVEDVEDVNQCIRGIITTPRGSVPHEPEFGSDVYLNIDAPVNVAVPAMIRDAHEAIRLWEPRAVVEKVTPRWTGEAWELEVTWRPAGALAAAIQATRVRV